MQHAKNESRKIAKSEEFFNTLLEKYPLNLMAAAVDSGLFDTEGRINDLKAHSVGLETQIEIAVKANRDAILGSGEQKKNILDVNRSDCNKDRRDCDLAKIFLAEDYQAFCKNFQTYMQKNNSSKKLVIHSLKTVDSSKATNVLEYVLPRIGYLCVDFRKPQDYLTFFTNRANDPDYLKRAFAGKHQTPDETTSETFEDFSSPKNLHYEFHIDDELGKEIRQLDLALQNLPAAYKTSLEASRPFLGDEFVNKALANIPVDKTPASQESENALALGKDQIRDVQSRLNATGAQVKVDGKMGSTARAALRQWQGALGYEPTGYLNQVQLNELRERTKDKVALLPAAPETSSEPEASKKNEKVQKPKKQQAGNSGRRKNGDQLIGRVKRNDAGEDVGRVLGTILGIGVRRCIMGQCF